MATKRSTSAFSPVVGLVAFSSMIAIGTTMLLSTMHPGAVTAFVVVPSASSSCRNGKSLPLLSYLDSLDGRAEDPVGIAEDDSSSSTTATLEDKATATSNDNIVFLQTLGAITGRGEHASQEQHEAAKTVIQAMEGENSRSNSVDSTQERLQGRWELVYSSTLPFRSSPFFMAGRAVCQTEQQAAQYDWFCQMHRKALAVSTITGVRQIITQDNKLVSEFEVEAGAIPFLSDLTPFKYSGGMPVTITGAIVSTADLMPIASSSDVTAWELYMDTVEIKGSNIPGLRQVLDMDAVQLESRSMSDFLEENLPEGVGYKTPKPVFRTTWLSDDSKFRVCRDMDDNIFVYCKTSEETTLTDYSSTEADFGLLRFLEGFNDAITRIQI